MAYLDGRQPSSSSHNTFQGQGSLEGGGGGEQEERRETIPVEVHQIRCAEDGDEQVWVKLLYRLVLSFFLLSVVFSFLFVKALEREKKEFPFLFFLSGRRLFPFFCPLRGRVLVKRQKGGKE